MKRLISGIQPTGNIHLGNYLGAIKNWVRLQDLAESFFFIVDYHAITVPQDPDALRRHNLQIAALYLAAGVNPEKSSIFIQSDVPAHTELMWILACQTPLGWLNRMTQYKDKAGSNRQNERLGLYAYPVLMAADILSYQVSHVPVGEDQKQHLELTRDLAISINQHYKSNLFAVPEPYIVGEATRVMSLRDGTKKMSKSDPSDGARIHLLDTPDEIRLKIRKAKTDSLPFPNDEDEAIGRSEIINLINIYCAITQISSAQVFKEFGGKNMSSFKEKLSDVCVAIIEPMGRSYHQWMDDPAALKQFLRKGSEKASDIAENTLKKVKNAFGLGL